MSEVHTYTRWTWSPYATHAPTSEAQVEHWASTKYWISNVSIVRDGTHTLIVRNQTTSKLRSSQMYNKTGRTAAQYTGLFNFCEILGCRHNWFSLAHAVQALNIHVSSYSTGLSFFVTQLPRKAKRSTIVSSSPSSTVILFYSSHFAVLFRW